MKRAMMSLMGAGLVAAVAFWGSAARTARSGDAEHRLDAERIGQAAGTKATTTLEARAGAKDH